MNDETACKLALLRQAARGIPFEVPHAHGEMLVLLLLERFIVIVTEQTYSFVPALTEAGKRLLLLLEPSEDTKTC